MTVGFQSIMMKILHSFSILPISFSLLSVFLRMSSFVRKFATVSESTKKIIFSGIQPSGIPHIGNYFGALKNWVQLQKLSDGMELDKYKELLSLEQNKIYFGIMSYHALTTQNDPQLLHDNILYLLSAFLIFLEEAMYRYCHVDWNQLKILYYLFNLKYFLTTIFYALPRFQNTAN